MKHVAPGSGRRRPGREDLRRARAQQLAALIGPFAVGLAALYVFYGATFVLIRERHWASDTAWCLAMAACLSLLAVLGLRHRIPPHLAEPVALGVSLVLTANAVGYVLQTRDPKETTNAMLLLIGAAVVFPSVWAFAVAVVAVLGAWAYLWVAIPSPEWSYFGYALVSGTVVAVLIFVTRRDGARRLEEARAELRHLAVVDELTGLHNRRGFHVLAEQAMLDADRSGHPFTMLFVDVDGLKSINDTEGHRAGDAVLQETASLLRAAFRGADVVARLGGDEFCILLPDAAPGVSYRDRLASVIIEANARDDRAYQLSVSVGEARYDPRQPRPIEELLAMSDREMYADKAARR